VVRETRAAFLNQEVGGCAAVELRAARIAYPAETSTLATKSNAKINMGDQESPRSPRSPNVTVMRIHSGIRGKARRRSGGD